MKLAKYVIAASLICIAGSAWAQQEVQKGERIEITGSSIKRIQEEGVLPVQVITREEISRAGLTTIEMLLDTISANVSGAYNLASQQGFLTSFARTSNGQSNANLRGLGSGNTLVLLNGRRISTHGLGGRAVDLNSIPLDAVERVEVLKDGASAIYGTDAIGGVINFILRKDYNGAQVSGSGDWTQHGGGNIYRGNLLAGWGALERDRFNVMASLTHDKNEKLRASQRDFASNGFQPERGLSPDTTGTPFANIATAAGTALAASFRIPGNTQLFSRASLLALQGKCDSIPHMSPYQGALWGNPSLGLACAYDYGASAVLQQQVERTNLVARGTVALAARHTAFAEVVASRTKSQMEFTESQIGVLNYPATGPYYVDLSRYIPSFDRTKPERVRWRCLECGPRQQTTRTDAFRFQVGLEGLLGTWDYKLGLSSAGSKADTILTDGYVYTAGIASAFATGLINPFLLPGQTQTPAALALIDSVKARNAPLFGGKATVRQFDGTLSGDVLRLPAGPLAAAVGFDFRKESYLFRSDTDSQPAIRDAGGDPLLNKATRDIKAVFAELNVPVVKGLEVQLAVRRDDYSKIGSTTNPKVAVSYRPTSSVLLRASANKGFHAPDYPQLYSGQIEGLLNNAAADPVLCPQHPGDPDFCAVKFDTFSGGNPGLKPEKSKQYSFGMVIAPTAWLTATLDYWKIERTDRIVSLDPRDVLKNFDVLGGNIIRGADGRIEHIVGGFINAAGDEVKGIDVGFNVSTPVGMNRLTFAVDGTYLQSFKSRLLENQPFAEYAGEFGSGSFTDVYARWKHYARLTLESGPLSTTFYQRYVSAYKDQQPLGVIPPGFDPYVHRYIVYNLMATYKGVRNTTITAGIKNLFDKDPPFSAHNVDDVGGAGWDARVGDPRGRSFFLSLAYKFR